MNRRNNEEEIGCPSSLACLLDGIIKDDNSYFSFSLFLLPISNISTSNYLVNGMNKYQSKQDRNRRATSNDYSHECLSSNVRHAMTFVKINNDRRISDEQHLSNLRRLINFYFYFSSL